MRKLNHPNIINLHDVIIDVNFKIFILLLIIFLKVIYLFLNKKPKENTVKNICDNYPLD